MKQCFYNAQGLKDKESIPKDTLLSGEGRGGEGGRMLFITLLVK